MVNEVSLPPPIDDFDGWADYYFDEWGVNVIPAPTSDKNKPEGERQFTWPKGGWDQFQHRAMTREEHETFKQNGDYALRKGLAVVAGQIWRGPNKGLWLTFAEADNQLGIDCLLKVFEYDSLECMSKDFVVEQHKDAPDTYMFTFTVKFPLVI